MIPLTVTVASNAGEFLSSRTLLRMSATTYVQKNSAWNSRMPSCSQVYYYNTIIMIVLYNYITSCVSLFSASKRSLFSPRLQLANTEKHNHGVQFIIYIIYTYIYTTPRVCCYCNAFEPFNSLCYCLNKFCSCCQVSGWNCLVTSVS